MICAKSVPQTRTPLRFHAVAGAALALANTHVAIKPFPPSQKSHDDALHRVFRPPSHHLHTLPSHLNGGVPQVLAVYTRSSITTVQFLVTGGLVTCPWAQKLPGAPSAAYSKRQPESATNWIQHHAKCHDGDCIDEDNCK